MIVRAASEVELAPDSFGFILTSCIAQSGSCLEGKETQLSQYA